jgi:hypothetical protein
VGFQISPRVWQATSDHRDPEMDDEFKVRWASSAGTINTSPKTVANRLGPRIFRELVQSVIGITWRYKNLDYAS